MDWEIFRPSRATAICLILLAFSFLLMTFRMTQKVEAFRHFLFYWISPAQETAMGAIDLTEDSSKRLLDLVRAHRENSLLKEKMAEFALLETQYRETLNENQRLRELLKLKSSLHYGFVPASVSARDNHNWSAAVWIDRGSAEGVREDLPVLSVRGDFKEPGESLGGVVGRIVECARSSCKVLLISDPISSIAASFPRTGEQGLVQGQGSFVVTVEYLDPAADVQPGDLVVTSGLGGLFPSGLPVGKVTQVTTLTSGFKRADIIPQVPLNQAREVLVLVPEGGAKTFSP